MKKPCPVCGTDYEAVMNGKEELHRERHFICTPALRSLVRAAGGWYANREAGNYGHEPLNETLDRAVARFQKQHKDGAK